MELESDAEKFSDTSLLQEFCSRELLCTSASDEAVSGTCTTLSEADEQCRVPVKLKNCIEKEYVHEINVDHSMLVEELEKRRIAVDELEKCSSAVVDRENTVERHKCSKGVRAKSNNISLPAATPKTPRTPGAIVRAARSRLTGESIRKLVKMVSPATHRRHHSTELHSSGSSLSGNTPTGSARSLSGACDLELSSVVISETNASS